MPTYKNTVMIRARPFDRAVEVTLDCPAGVSIPNLQELAERAWRAPGKAIEVDGTRVRVLGGHTSG